MVVVIGMELAYWFPPWCSYGSGVVGGQCVSCLGKPVVAAVRRLVDCNVRSLVDDDTRPNDCIPLVLVVGMSTTVAANTQLRRL